MLLTYMSCERAPPNEAMRGPYILRIGSSVMFQDPQDDLRMRASMLKVALILA